MNRLGLVALLVGGFLALVAAGLYAASLDWSHALVNLMLTLSVVLFLVASRIRGSSRKTDRTTPALEDAAETVEILPCIALATALTPPHTAAHTDPSE